MASTQYDEKPKPGDLIEISRGTYQHWAIYIGNGYVVHLAPPSEVPGAGINSMMSVLADMAIVKKEELWEVIGESFWKINNILDGKYEPRPVSIIVRDAIELVGEVMPYCLIRRNCEHFVTQLRYGKGQSRQVRQVGEAVMVAGGLTLGFLGIAALAATLFGGNKDKHKQ
ncbi:phospholipase A and acyltransferase 4-like [Corythoichthys intestinalis]|uniref:phospholipase A and acyltransferase 4-like n=1 Tax=Corythoichthys intestinalis TaxID=161448 RepID=UPI0025A589A9|nr:phospholipase A and acyltransferase 4-like [Corythoichthys intestinalis]